ncbi:MAG TPA: putative hydro-lyase [Thermodesulfobacteriota bacterium]
MQSASEARRAIRAGEWTGPTVGLAPRYAQANLVALPREYAYDFLLFCQRNPRPCPLLEVLDVGATEPACAPGADLRTDLPRYRVWRDGVLADEPTDVRAVWRDDLVAFLIGCSLSFEGPLLEAGLEVRHVSERRNVPMYRTSRPTVPAGPFRGPLVVTMRPFKPAEIPRVVEITGRVPRVHGAPIHVGEPAGLGIADLGRPDYGDPVTVHPGEVPVFWACGVTPQAALLEARLPFAITHAPGHMFVTDLPGSGPFPGDVP